MQLQENFLKVHVFGFSKNQDVTVEPQAEMMMMLLLWLKLSLA
jgi:hypothetical protein